MAESEASLTQKLLSKIRGLRPQAVVLKFNDRVTSGIPDFAVADGLTVWGEVKYADPDFESTGLQELTCLRLDKRSICRYIIYDDNDGSPRVGVLTPDEFSRNWQVLGQWYGGFNHLKVAEHITRLCSGLVV